MLEEAIEKPAVEFAKEMGWHCRKLQWVGRRGAPDRFFFKEAVGFFWVEFKRPGKRPTAQQAREIRRMREAGMLVHVIDNLEAAYALFA